MNKFRVHRKFFAKYLDDNEKIYHIGHKNVANLFINLLKSFFIYFLIPYIIYEIAKGVNIDYHKEYIYVFCFFIFFGILRIIKMIIIWYFDAWLITSLGIIDIEWKSLLNKSSTRIDYQTIEGVTYEINGLFPTILNYGDIYIDRVGNGTPVTLRNAKNPKSIELMILKCQYLFKTRRNFQESNTLNELMDLLKKNNTNNN
jgi:hypothetical protein